MKVGGLYRITSSNYLVSVWANTNPKDVKWISQLDKGDLFVIVATDGIYTQVLIPKNGRSGFVQNLKDKLHRFEEVEIEE